MKHILLVCIGISFLGFVASLVARNTNNHKKKSLKYESLYHYLSAVSIIIMLILAILYNIFYI